MRYLPRVIEVQVTGPHRLRLRFDDGNGGELDFADRHGVPPADARQWRGVFEPLAESRLLCPGASRARRGDDLVAQRR
jgi:hypothetical protein